ncbi:hypothetical protein ACFPVT_00075 [Corynebacterium choanae]|uniref:hypothetical protein n=1 Tax=Corynebacterium choanae TaxID=1862358 RepID=UPI000F4EB1AF|nr:hypothetical protein [Corynebacterium choanae]
MTNRVLTRHWEVYSKSWTFTVSRIRFLQADSTSIRPSDIPGFYCIFVLCEISENGITIALQKDIAYFARSWSNTKNAATPRSYRPAAIFHNPK